MQGFPRSPGLRVLRLEADTVTWTGKHPPPQSQAQTGLPASEMTQRIPILFWEEPSFPCFKDGVPPPIPG